MTWAVFIGMALVVAAAAITAAAGAWCRQRARQRLHCQTCHHPARAHWVERGGAAGCQARVELTASGYVRAVGVPCRCTGMVEG